MLGDSTAPIIHTEGVLHDVYQARAILGSKCEDQKNVV